MEIISVSCTAKSELQAGRIVDDLRGSYYSKNQISVLFPDKRARAGFDGTAAAGMAGGVLGWLAGMGALAIPGLGAFIASGPLMTALGGAAMGGIAGALVGLGLPDHQAQRYETKVKSGHVLISVRTKDAEEARFAKEIFRQQGAEDISSTGDMAVPMDRLAERRMSAPSLVRFLFS